jgi:hypothetical protein
MADTAHDPARSRPDRLVVTLAVVAGVLLLAVVALAFLQIGRGIGDEDEAGGPSSSPSSTVSGATPSPTSAEPTPSATTTTTTTTTAPPAEDTSPRFASFSAPTETVCDAGDEDNQPPKPPILVSWSSVNAVEAWYSPSDEDAKDDNYMQIPLSGNQDDLTDEHLFPCFHETEHDYTITLVGQNGEHVSKHWTVTNVGDQ